MKYFSKFYVKGVGKQNIQTSHQGDLRKTGHVKQITSTHQISRYKANSGKN